jgi:hypothetical protein
MEIKTEVREVEVIETFLAAWKEKAKKFYSDLVEEFLVVDNAENELIEKARRAPYGSEEEKQIQFARQQNKLAQHQVLSKTNQTMKDIIRWKRSNAMAYINEQLDREVKAKRKSLITRVKKVVGEINDASGLYVASNGEINGIVVGSLSKAEVRTIFAGGYNIQVLHYRVLVKGLR